MLEVIKMCGMFMEEIIFCGDDVLVYNFDDRVKIFYPPDPIPPLEDPDRAVLDAIRSPIGSKPISELVDAASNVVIAFDDMCVPLPHSRKKDPRAIAARAVVAELENAGVKKENITFICARGLHRRCKPQELRMILGSDIVKEFKDRILHHNPTDPGNLVKIGETPSGHVVEINKVAAEADLLIYLNITFTPMNGGWKSFIIGLGSYSTIRASHIPEVTGKGHLMDPERSMLHKIIWEMGQVLKERVNVFTVESVVNNDFYSGLLGRLWRPLKGQSSRIRKILLKLMGKSPKFLKRIVRRKYRANYAPIGFFAGDPEEAHKETLKLVEKQMLVRVDQQFDVVIFGLPNLCPYSVGTELNPVLLHTTIFGYLVNMYKGKPPLKRGGVLVVANPAEKVFDLEQHPSYAELYYKILPNITKMEDLENYEKEFLEREDLMQKFVQRYAYHPIHAIIAYYWGAMGRKHAGRTIIAGAKSEDVLKRLGLEDAKDLDDAIRKAKEYAGEDASIAYLFMPPLFIADLSASI